MSPPGSLQRWYRYICTSPVCGGRLLATVDGRLLATVGGRLLATADGRLLATALGRLLATAPQLGKMDFCPKWGKRGTGGVVGTGGSRWFQRHPRLPVYSTFRESSFSEPRPGGWIFQDFHCFPYPQDFHDYHNFNDFPGATVSSHLPSMVSNVLSIDGKYLCTECMENRRTSKP